MAPHTLLLSRAVVAPYRGRALGIGRRLPHDDADDLRPHRRAHARGLRRRNQPAFLSGHRRHDGRTRRSRARAHLRAAIGASELHDDGTVLPAGQHGRREPAPPGRDPSPTPYTTAAIMGGECTMRAAIYARYSSDLQRDASIEDQVRLCKSRIQREGWSLSAAYTDRAQSGASRLRPGYQSLLEDALKGRFDLVLTEALDRLSRDQEDTAALYKQLTFAGVKLVTLAEGEITELHVGLKGTMNALFLKDLG